jgi:hypothetical protein
MPEPTVKLSIDVPKAFLQQALDRKPKWLVATDEQFLGKMFSGGNFDEFFKSYEGFNQKLTEAQRLFLQAVNDISQKVGAKIDAPLIKTTRKKAAARAAEAPPSSERSSPAAQ